MKQLITMIAFFLLLAGLPFAGAQTQLGGDITSSAEGLNSGGQISFSSDGNRLAVASPDEQSFTGAVRVYEWANNSWTQLGSDITGSESFEDFGGSISLSGNGMRIAIANSEANDFDGFVKVYEWANNSWTQLGADIIGTSGTSFGEFVDLSADGSRLVVGIFGDIFNNIPPEVRVYQWANNAWTQLGTGIQSGFDLFCWISDDGSRIAVDGENSMGDFIAQVYEWQNNSWTQLGANIPLDSDLAFSGDGNRVAVSDLTDMDDDVIRVYDWVNNAWTQIGGDIGYDPETNDLNIPLAISTKGNHIALGRTAAGETRLLEYNGTTWTALGNNVTGPVNGTNFGTNVAISGTGQRMAVGNESMVDQGGGTVTSTVKVYDFSALTTAVDIAGIQVDVFPNPTTDFIQIKGIAPDFVRVLDQNGRLMRTINSGQQKVDLSGFPAGLYILEIAFEGQWGTVKLIKE